MMSLRIFSTAKRWSAENADSVRRWTAVEDDSPAAFEHDVPHLVDG